MSEKKEELKELAQDLESLEEKVVESADIKSVGIEREQIRRAFEEYFLDTNLFTGNVVSLSPASRFFQNLVGKASSMLFSKMPYIKADGRILEIIEAKQGALEELFSKAVDNYIVYGKSLVLLDGVDLFVYEGDFEILDGGVIKLSSVLTENGIETLREQGEYISQEQEYDILFFDGKEQIRLEEGKYVVIRENSIVDVDCTLMGSGFISYCYDLFSSLEKLYAEKLNTISCLRVVALATEENRNVVEKLQSVDNKFSVVFFNDVIHSSASKGLTNLLQYLPNDPVALTLDIQEKQIEGLKNEIIELAGLSDVFTGMQRENTSETRIAAEARVGVSQVAWQREQHKINNFVENLLKKWLIVQGIDKVLVDKIELDAVSLLEQEQREMKNEADLGKIIGLIGQSRQAGSPAEVELYMGLLDELVEKSSFSSDIKDRIGKMKQELIEMKIEEAQAPNIAQEKAQEIEMKQVDLGLAKQAEDLESARANRVKVEAETGKVIEETQLMDRSQDTRDMAELRRVEETLGAEASQGQGSAPAIGMRRFLNRKQ